MIRLYNALLENDGSVQRVGYHMNFMGEEKLEVTQGRKRKYVGL